MFIKHAIRVLLAALLLFSLTGCGGWLNGPGSDAAELRRAVGELGVCQRSRTRLNTAAQGAQRSLGICQEKLTFCRGLLGCNPECDEDAGEVCMNGVCHRPVDECPTACAADHFCHKGRCYKVKTD